MAGLNDTFGGQVRIIDVIMRKAEKGLKSVEGLIHSKVLNNEQLSIIVLTARYTTHEDVFKQELSNVPDNCKIYVVTLNIASPKEVIENLNYYQRKGDMVLLAIPPGSDVVNLNDDEVIATALSLDVHFITVIPNGNSENIIEQVADETFPSINDFINFVLSAYGKACAELQKSKADFIEQVTKQLAYNYEEKVRIIHNEWTQKQSHYVSEIANLQQQLHAHVNDKSALNTTIEILNSKVQKANKRRVLLLILIVAALIVGWFIGRFVMHP